MSRRPEDQQMSGTLVDVVRDLGHSLGSLSSASALLGLLSIAIGLILLITVSEVRAFGYAILGLGLVLVSLALITARRTVTKTLTGRQGRYSINTLVMSMAFVAVVGFLNFVAFDNPARMDVTSTKQFSLATRTKDLLKDLNEPVEALAFFDKDAPEQEAVVEAVDNMLHEFDARSSKFSYKIVDPAAEPNTARQYGVTSYGQVAFVAKESGSFDLALGAFVVGTDPVTGRGDVVANPLMEQEFLTPLLVVTGEERKSVYFLKGHGERDFTSLTDDRSYFEAAAALEFENYSVQTLDLQEQTLVPKTGEDSSDDPSQVSPTVIIVAGPQRNLLPNEAEALKEYLKRGGRMMLLLDPDTPDSFRDFLDDWGVDLGRGNIVDQQDFLRPDKRTPFITRHNPALELTSTLERTYFPGATSLGPLTGQLPPIRIGEQQVPLDIVPLLTDPSDPRSPPDPWGSYALVIELSGQEGPVRRPIVLVWRFANTSGDSWLIGDLDRTDPNEGVDPQGPFSVAVLIEAGWPVDEEISLTDEVEGASLVVIGDSDFAANKDFNNADNGALFLNSVNELADDVALIGIRPNREARRELLTTPGEFDTIRYTSWFLVPALMATSGVWVWWRRR